MTNIQFEVASAEQTRDLGERVGSLLCGGDVLLLIGDLGAGKTTFVQGLARGLGVVGNVTSPTYIIARVHESRGDGPALIHADAYRVSDELDLETIDLDATVEDSVTVVEWGRGRAEALQDERLEIEFDFEGGSDEAFDAIDEPRVIRLKPIGENWVARLKEVDIA
ncbi:tRNA (adenosine(37)-N6)-threonylcarbamoyltransferase complex ATPase subunit type 1 TsaE [Actinomycetaceae bacterium MB13-C1-2]|nr:tRNA (adenosine(37)-N6)-threonylcarbamoyltransferase complex ATPase subunit type 1 TsaE [Actinomycetaceae bacterium MB13-C1-2]